MSAGPSRPLDEVIDRCIDDITAGRRSVAECLAAYPEHRDELEPLLSAAGAVRTLPRVAERAPDAARRAAFMAELGRTPQQSARRAFTAPRMRLPRFDGLRGRVIAFATVAAPAAAAAAIALLLVLGGGSTPASASTLTVFAGSVEQEHDGAWTPLADGETLGEGARLRTTADGRAMLTFPDGSTVTLAPTTELVIARLHVNGVRDVVLDQQSGRLWNDVVPDPRSGSSYVVRANGVTTSVSGTVFETAIDNGETAVTTADGTVNVEAGDDTVEVARGESVRATAQRIEALAVVPPTGAVTVDGPYTASLIAADGAATGARPDGVTFSQIAGATTSDPASGPQRIDLLQPTPGDYTLVLRPFADGGGVVVIEIDGQVVTIPVDGPDDLQVALRVTRIDGHQAIEVLDREDVDSLVDSTRERVVETRRTTSAVSVAASRAAQSSSTARTPTPTPTPGDRVGRRDAGRSSSATATPEASGRTDQRGNNGNNDGNNDDNDSRAGRGSDPGADAAADARVRALNAARARLRAALSSRRQDALASVVGALLAPDSTVSREDAVRLLLAEGTRSRTATTRLRALATSDGPLGAQLRDALEAAAPGDLRSALDTLLGERGRATPIPTPTTERDGSQERRRGRDSAPTPTSAPTDGGRILPRLGDLLGTPTPTATPTSTPTAAPTEAATATPTPTATSEDGANDNSRGRNRRSDDSNGEGSNGEGSNNEHERGDSSRRDTRGASNVAAPGATNAARALAVGSEDEPSREHTLAEASSAAPPTVGAEADPRADARARAGGPDDGRASDRANERGRDARRKAAERARERLRELLQTRERANAARSPIGR